MKMSEIAVKETMEMTVGHAALVRLMQCYLDGLLDPFITPRDVHWLMYFMQEAGEQLRLNYTKYNECLYAEMLHHLLETVDGKLINGYTADDGFGALDRPLTLVPGVVEEARKFFNHHGMSRQRFGRVLRLIEGFESPFGLELLATVHWVVNREGATQCESIQRQVYNCNDRKRQFTPRQIAIAQDRLCAQGWLPA